MRNWFTATWKNDRLVFCVWAISVALLIALLIGFGFALVLFGYAKLFGGMGTSPTERLRDIALTVAAILGFPLLLQRTRTATKQADTDSRRLLADRYTRAAELFANAELSARLAGLYALWDLAKDEVEIYHLRIMEILCVFVRNPSNLKGVNYHDDKLRTLCPDMEAVLNLIRVRNKEQCAWEHAVNYRLNFHKANLASANLQGADLRGACFAFADLRGACLVNIKLNGTEDFEDAALNGTSFWGVDDESIKKSIHSIRKGVILLDKGALMSPPVLPILPFNYEGSINELHHMERKDWQLHRESSRR